MLTGAHGQVLVHHLFAYEAQAKLRHFLNACFDGQIALKPKNVSPEVSAPLSPEIRAKLKAARAEEFALYDSVIAANGHLVTKI